jgi:hypothetical protein
VLLRGLLLLLLCQAVNLPNRLPGFDFLPSSCRLLLLLLLSAQGVLLLPALLRLLDRR